TVRDEGRGPECTQTSKNSAVDILSDIPGVDFGAAWERRVEDVVDPASQLKASFISREDLIAAKLASGRQQDLADVDALRKAEKSRLQKETKASGIGRRF